MTCRCCGHNRREKCRQLCWSCYYRPGVRERFPPVSKYASPKGAGDHFGGRELAEFPTRAYPGQAEKVDVMAHRARLGKAIFHPGDWRIGDEDQLPLKMINGRQPEAGKVQDDDS